MGKHEEAHKEHINQYKMAHMIGVAEYMRERALDYNKADGVYIDPNEAYTVGLLHDIGYLIGRPDHEKTGAELLAGMGLRDDLFYAIKFHGTNPYTIEETYGKENNGEPTISPMQVLLYEADMSINIQGYRVGFDKRLEDIRSRLQDTPYGEAAIDSSTSIVQYVKEWQAEHGIDKPSRSFWTHKKQEQER